MNFWDWLFGRNKGSQEPVPTVESTSKYIFNPLSKSGLSGFLKSTAVAPDRIVRDSNFKRGQYPSIHFTIKPGDCPDGRPDAEKNELIGLTDNSGKNVLEVNNSTIYYGISVFLPLDWKSPVSDKGGYNHFTFLQFKSSVSPTVAIMIMGEDFLIKTNTGIDGNTQKEYTIGLIERGRWTKLIFQLRFDISTGILKVWKNDTPVLNVSNVPTGITGCSYEVHIGAYRSAQNFTETFWIGDFVRAITFNDVLNAIK